MFTAVVSSEEICLKVHLYETPSTTLQNLSYFWTQVLYDPVIKRPTHQHPFKKSGS